MQEVSPLIYLLLGPNVYCPGLIFCLSAYLATSDANPCKSSRVRRHFMQQVQLHQLILLSSTSTFSLYVQRSPYLYVQREAAAAECCLRSAGAAAAAAVQIFCELSLHCPAALTDAFTAVAAEIF